MADAVRKFVVNVGTLKPNVLCSCYKIRDDFSSSAFSDHAQHTRFVMNIHFCRCSGYGLELQVMYSSHQFIFTLDIQGCVLQGCLLRSEPLTSFKLSVQTNFRDFVFSIKFIVCQKLCLLEVLPPPEN